MKTLFIIFSVLMLILVSPNQSLAQAFEGKGSKTFTAGIGFSQYTAFYPDDDNGFNKGSVNPLSFNLSVQGEFGIHDYVGLGFMVGITYSNSLGNRDIFVNSIYWNGSSYSDWRSLGIPIAMIGNFHFLQLIADKTGGSFAEDMDVYAGLTLGVGPSFAIAKSGNNAGGDTGVIVFGEVRVGIRYYFNDKLGVFAEVGQGRGSRLQGGLAFKF